MSEDELIKRTRTPATRESLQRDLQGMAEGLRRGIPPQATSLDPMLERHRAWVGRAWGGDCPPEAYAGLADIYEHPDFRARYEAIEPGFADYLMTAMRSWAKRQKQG